MSAGTEVGEWAISGSIVDIEPDRMVDAGKANRIGDSIGSRVPPAWQINDVDAANNVTQALR